MKRLSLLTILLLIVCILSGQIKPDKNNIQQLKEPFIKVTLPGTGTPPPVTTPEQASKVFNEVKPKLAVYSQISKHGRNEQELLKRTQAVYTGPVVVGEDLMSFSIADSVTINAWQNK